MKMRTKIGVMLVALMVMVGGFTSCDPAVAPVATGSYYKVIDNYGISYVLEESGSAIISVQQTYHAEGIWTRDGDDIFISHSKQQGRPLGIFEGSSTKARAFGDYLLVYDKNGEGHSFPRIAD